MVFDHTGASGTATVQVGNASVTVTVNRGATAPAPTATINGRPSAVRQYPGNGGSPILQVDIDDQDRVVDLLAEGHYDQTTVVHIAEGYRDIAAVDPDAWPVNPLT